MSESRVESSHSGVETRVKSRVTKSWLESRLESSHESTALLYSYHNIIIFTVIQNLNTFINFYYGFRLPDILMSTYIIYPDHAKTCLNLFLKALSESDETIIIKIRSRVGKVACRSLFSVSYSDLHNSNHWNSQMNRWNVLLVCVCQSEPWNNLLTLKERHSQAMSSNNSQFWSQRHCF
jgi:hypothetical protein